MAGGRLEGRVALVTGASRGFGRAIALAFAREGARLAANYFASEREGKDVAAEAGRLGVEAIALRGDVSQEEDARALIKGTLDRFGRLDILVNLSSQLAQRAVGGGGFAAYAATKGAIESLTRALASEVGGHGITVNAISPGGIETDMSKDVMTPEYRARRLAELPLRRFGDVADVAYCAVVLAADDAGYLTGQILHPSGGWVSG